MVYQGVISPVQVTEGLNNVHFDVKAAVRASQSEIRILIDELGDPNKDLIVDGKKYSGSEKFGAAASLALTNKMAQLQDTTTSIIGVFSELYKLEKSLGGLTS